MKISFLEKGIIALTVVFLALLVGYFWMENRAAEPYSVTAQTLRISEVGAGVEQSSVVINPVNINTADTDELQTLPGIGPVLAEAIVEDRRVNGPFRIPEDIIRVPGIGQGTLEEIQNYITVG